jgi:hypothetical protein
MDDKYYETATTESMGKNSKLEGTSLILPILSDSQIQQINHMFSHFVCHLASQ